MSQDKTGETKPSPSPDRTESTPALSDPLRLEAVQRTGLLNEAPPGEFERLLSLMVRCLDGSGAAFLLVSGDGFHCRGSVGLPDTWTGEAAWPLEWPYLLEAAFEGPVAVSGEPMPPPGIPDNPFRAFAGVPLRDPDGRRLGLLALWCGRERTWTARDQELLRGFAASAEDLLAHRLRARAREEDLKASADRLRQAVESGSDLLYEWDLVSGALRTVGSLDRLLGYSKGELTLHHGAWQGVLHPEDRERVEARVRRHLEAGEPFFEEYRVVCKDGSVRHWSDRGRALRNAQGRAVRWVGMVNDISERKRIEEALKRSREERDVILGTVEFPVLARDRSGRIVFANQAAARFLGFAAPEGLQAAPRTVIGDRFALADDQGRPVDAEDLPGLIATRNGDKPGTVFRFTSRADGRSTWAAVNATAVKDAQGEVRLTITVLHDITPLKQAQLDLGRSRDELEVILRTMDSACTAQDAAGKLVFANRAAASMLGYASPEDLLKAGAREVMDRFETVDAQGRPFPVERLPGRAALQGRAVSGELIGYRVKATGETRWSLVNGTPVFDGEGKARLAINVFHDISALKRAEEALRVSESRLSLIFHHVSDAVTLVALEPDGGCRVVLANPPCLAQSRIPDQVVGARFEDFLPPAEAEERRAFFHAVAASGRPAVEEAGSPVLKGSPTLETVYTPIRGQDGSCTHILCVSRDVSSRREAEDARIRHLRHMEKADAVARAAESALDAEKVLPAALEKMVEVMDCDRALLIHPADPDALEFRVPFAAARGGGGGEPKLSREAPVKAIIGAVLAEEGPVAFGPEGPGGTAALPDPRFWSEALGAASLLALAVRPRAGKPWLLCLLRPAGARPWSAEETVLFRDIGPRITAALGNMLLYKDLRRSEEKYRTLFERSLDGIFRCAPDGTVLDANPALVEMLGRSGRADLVGEAQPQLLPAGGEARAAGREPFIVELKRKDGTRIWAEVIAQAIRRSDGTVACYEGMVRDIDDRKRSEAALRENEEVLRQAQKMEAVGRLAGGVAHDFNNLLTAINGFGDLLLMQVGKEDPRRMHVEEIRKAGERAAGLTSQLLAFSRKQVLAPRHLDLNAVVAGMEPMLRRLIGENIAFEIVPSAGLPRVVADPNQAEQIVMNLALNARDAMPTGGRLRIATGARRLEGRRAPSLLEVKDGDYVMLTVADTGTGMDEETKARLFEPFFTTKDKDKGTGLGLSMVYGAVKQANGTIEVDTRPGFGTSFRVLLPAALDEAAPASARPARPSAARGGDNPSRGTGTVLLVEDEDAVRRLVRDVLQFHGYQVLEAPGGERALEVASAHAGSIHLLLTDVVMGGMSGRELAERLLAVRPATRVLYMSGYTEDAIIRHGVLSSQTAFIGKPFSPAALAAKVRAVLAGETVGSGATQAAEPRS